MKDLLYIAGGALLGLGLAVFYENNRISKKGSGSKEKQEKTVSDVFNDISKEQLVVDELNSSDLTSWFKAKNPKGNKKNVLFYLNEETIKKFKFPKDIKLTEKTIIQALCDKNDDIVLCRSIFYEKMNPHLEEIFKKSDGIIIIE